MRTEPRILYSANAELAYKIGTRFYGDVHFVWCSPDFGSGGSGPGDDRNPPTSRPYKRYRDLAEEAEGGDTHGLLIASTRTGLRKGVIAKYKQGVISLDERNEILEIIERAPPADYKPLMYVMPYEDVKHLVRTIPVADRAHALSMELLIEELPGNLFHKLTF